ncbi:MAG: helicase [Candidatus Muproteobacteria bacterium RIFCSPHIGHO2_12_FULL_60_33]|uniref:Helicase n=1 Tax=Candidatus Muproteobacteria bacterium RIFCSPLOWO2_01_FULL_60_18 TaxID=1817768 RepID=A0A1F6U0D8_9PROT|nr:MAG: helicase [Candidatus Muproteobacteria bacterium RIFCSPLOWO2_01_FULL_60_18]OGI55305.1 MAG: helicase [Candidatus Muproteobacteria bacterium RIFCSPHIGHO2_12_FULL_60_33]OGI60468.1 MAG: helicase [Candidatus Muproteobacteria bacterium RIFCSPHIGHO2_01_FULL_61_200]
MPVNSKDILGFDGPLAGRLEGFTPRRAQQEMAARIEQALADYAVFIAESGTGTGKTFAYLVPALLSGKKILISTGTRHLQDQLYHRDFPIVRDAVAVPVTSALLKGRSNYLCRHRLERAETEGRLGGRRERSNLALIREWSGRTQRGDIAEMNRISEDSDLWLQVTSTADNCLGSGCSHYDECFVNRARREALAADVVVVNHHLFFADLALREEGFGQLLPGVEAVIFDEAHQLPEVASNFLGLSLSSHQLASLCRDAIAEDLKEHSGVAGLPPATQLLEKALADFRLAFGVEPRRTGMYQCRERQDVESDRRDAWDKLENAKVVHAALAELKSRLTDLSAVLDIAAGKGQGLANCARRASDLLDRLMMISESPPSEYVAWFETTARTFTLYLTPLDIAASFRQHTGNGKKAWIFTSATLAIKKSFAHFQARLGLEQAETGLWDSPFDYVQQTLLYIPPGLPAPSAPDYTDRVLDAALPVLRASRGRAFILFTSHRALKVAATRLRDTLDYPLLVQGDAPRSELLRRFRDMGNAVLLGTSSFWEGVDVRGEALSCVIIDKLPFASPDDPVLQARAAAMEQSGRSSFTEYQLPEAVITLKQGVGRLIRDESDHGVLVLCDPRLLSKGYGKIFLASLPPMPLSRTLQDVEAFFARDNLARQVLREASPA